MFDGGKQLSFSTDFVVPATAETVRQTVADVERFFADLQHMRSRLAPVSVLADVLDTYPDGTPKNVRSRISMLGLTDDFITTYEWTDNCVILHAANGTVVSSQRTVFGIRPVTSGSHIAITADAELHVGLPTLLIRQLRKIQAREVANIRTVLANTADGRGRNPV